MHCALCTTQEYAQCIRDCAAKDPALLIAHHYTRYLGDLSGGQTLRRCAVRHFGLDKNSTQGVAFYCFPDIPSPKDFKNACVTPTPASTDTTHALHAGCALDHRHTCAHTRLPTHMLHTAHTPRASLSSPVWAAVFFFSKRGRCCAGGEQKRRQAHLLVRIMDPLLFPTTTSHPPTWSTYSPCRPIPPHPPLCPLPPRPPTHPPLCTLVRGV